jgi:hypothetical protein
MPLLWYLVFGNNGLRPYVLDHTPVNGGHPQVFVCGIFDDSFHFQLFTVQGETHAITQHDLSLGYIFYGPNAVQAQTVMCPRYGSQQILLACSYGITAQRLPASIRNRVVYSIWLCEERRPYT